MTDAPAAREARAMIEVPDETTGYILGLEEEVARLRNHVAALEADKARLVAALEFYANPANHVRPSQKPPEGVVYVSLIENDEGRRARAELDAVKRDGDGG